MNNNLSGVNVLFLQAASGRFDLIKRPTLRRHRGRPGLLEILHLQFYMMLEELMDKIVGRSYFNRAFDAVPDPLLIFGSDGEITWANGAAAECFKCSPEWLLGKHISELMDADLLLYLSSQDTGYLTGKTVPGKVVPFRTKGGTIIRMETRAQRLPDGYGRQGEVLLAGRMQGDEDVNGEIQETHLLPHYGKTVVRRTIPKLGAQELKVLVLLSRGYSNKEIGPMIGCNQRTAESHRKNLIDKLDARNTAHAIQIANDKGIIGSHSC